MKTSIDSEEQGEVLSEKDIDETSAAKVSISTTTEIYASKTSPDNAGRQYWLILGYIDRTLILRHRNLTPHWKELQMLGAQDFSELTSPVSIMQEGFRIVETSC